MIELFLIVICLGSIIGYFIFYCSLRSQRKSYNSVALSIIEQAELKAKQITLDAKEKAQDMLAKREHESKTKFVKENQALEVLKEQLDHKEARLLQERKFVEQKQLLLQKEEKHIQKLKQNCEEELARIAQMTKIEAEKYILQQVEVNLQTTCDLLIHKGLSQAKQAADREAAKILQTALARTASHVTANSSIELVTLPNNSFKGKIIGREGRNKKIFEDTAQVMLVIDASSNTIAISSFDPEKRYIAKKALEDLFSYTKVHQESIQECIANRTKTMEQEAYLLGKEAVLKVRLTDFHPQVLTTLGKLHFRLSLGQNVLRHVLEVASIMESLAAELQLDVERSKRMGLLHDIGKALPLYEGTGHAAAGASFLRQHGENEYICNGVHSHHGEIDVKTAEAALLKTADAISAARLGARDDKGIGMLQRLQNMESLAMQERGVRKAYAINAGRELQVIIESEINELQSRQLVDRLTLRMNQENTLAYPVVVSVVKT